MTYHNNTCQAANQERQEHQARFSGVEIMPFSEHDGISLKQEIEAPIGELKRGKGIRQWGIPRLEKYCYPHSCRQ